MPHAPYLDPYRQSHARHGAEFEVTCWASPESQARRFAVFAQMAFLPGKCVLDAGCSRGDFARFLLDRQVGFSRYIGIDALPQVIDFARNQALPGCEFFVGDFVTHPQLFTTGQPQVVCISGTLNTMDPVQVLALLEAAWKAADETLLFNFLSDRCSRLAPRETAPVRRHSLMKLLDWALSRSPHVALRQDYFPHGHDATIRMSKV